MIIPQNFDEIVDNYFRMKNELQKPFLKEKLFYQVLQFDRILWYQNTRRKSALSSLPGIGVEILDRS